MPVKFIAEVTRVTHHGGDVATYEFHCLTPRPRWKPGQFLHLALDPYDPSGHWPESRCFTMASGSVERDRVRLTIAAKGRFTRRVLAELRPGRTVWMKAPYGDFIVRTATGHHVVLIAGGTGITPFVAFMEDALVKGLEGDVWLHYGARTEDLLVFRDFACRCAERFPAFHLECYAEYGAGSREQGAGSQNCMLPAPSSVLPAPCPGRIDLARAVACVPNGPLATYYLCGPQEMIAAFRELLMREHGVPEAHVRVDAWE
jgi:ferredoxin-NADP reductase